ncbi:MULTISPECIES: MaoC family dehydratase N-terminal domain-containing protein [unclassified Streptomyces]|uniref:FAS1-like dehydratase domain-containing protein n=1 Tax=unclassified Streptomyces TaxID=2593676 RepID=UPI00278C38DA|nr:MULTISPECIES: MaoC family dehydratase N-terminal domain-containing protein [unclassified Streptomyces]
MTASGMGHADAFARIEAEWRPEPVETTEFLTVAPARALSGLFDQEPVVGGVGDALPPLWHWLYLLDRPAQAELGEDGHPRDGLFLPPLPERRRMFGGGRYTFRAPLRVGDLVTRRSEVVSVRVREGGSGPLLLVTVRHAYAVEGEVRTVEEQDIVYKRPGGVVAGAPKLSEQAAATTPEQPPQQPTTRWSFTLRPDPSLLFRFSALTYNAHRIHYDRDYARDVEGYPDLVVHGPLLALSLLELPRRYAPERQVAAFSFRAKAPLFAPREFAVRGAPEGDERVALNAGLPGVAPGITGEATFA